MEIPKKNKLIFTNTGFGVKCISKETLEKNKENIKHIAKQGEQKRLEKLNLQL